MATRHDLIKMITKIFNTSINKKNNLLLQDSAEDEWVLRFMCLKNKSTYNKDNFKLIAESLDKSYYSESSLLAKRMAASNFICRIWKEKISLKKQQPLEQ